MTLGEKLKSYRVRKGLSQEKVAEFLGVSRQAVTKWENDQTRPASGNLLALASLYGVSLDELVDGASQEGEAKRIRRSNLTLLAIICQAAALNVCIQPAVPEAGVQVGAIFLIIKFAILLACSIWMMLNLRYEKDPVQRQKNARIELAYCIVQVAVAITAYRSEFLFLGALVLIGVGLTYIFIINPRYMARTLVRQKSIRSAE